jgi:hypothetical protein
MTAGMSSSGTRPGFPVGSDGYWADVKSGAQRLRLLAEVSRGYLAQSPDWGWAACVLQSRNKVANAPYIGTGF